MSKPAGAEGDALETGSLYRLVPNWATHWDYARGVPEPRSFRKDGDIGVSMMIAQRATPAQMFEVHPHLNAFAVCEILVEDLLRDADVWVRLDPDDSWGHSES